MSLQESIAAFRSLDERQSLGKRKQKERRRARMSPDDPAGYHGYQAREIVARAKAGSPLAKSDLKKYGDRRRAQLKKEPTEPGEPRLKRKLEIRRAVLKAGMKVTVFVPSGASRGYQASDTVRWDPKFKHFSMGDVLIKPHSS